jgi:hypothetical protein
MTRKKKPEDLLKVGNPETLLDYVLVERLAAACPKLKELALLVGMSVSGFRKRRKNDPDLVAAIQRGKSETVQALRQKQVDVALEGDVVMLKHLGKHVLEQHDDVRVRGNLKVHHYEIKVPEDMGDENADNEEGLT